MEGASATYICVTVGPLSTRLRRLGEWATAQPGADGTNPDLRLCDFTGEPRCRNALK